MLIDPARHEPLIDETWDADRARAAVRAIVDDIQANRDPAGHWPVHPRDLEDNAPRAGFKSLYLGTAGVLWSLWWLQEQGAVSLQNEPWRDIERVHATYLLEPDDGELVPSYMIGEAGVLLVEWCVTRSQQAADKVYAVVESNIGNAANDPQLGAAGTMLAAWHLWEAAGDARFRELFLRNADHVFSTWQLDEAERCHLWTQNLWGNQQQLIGAGHGFAGNVQPLLLGASLLDDERREDLYERCVSTLNALAVRDAGGANWRPATAMRPDPKVLVQWCHGAPGVVTSLAAFPKGRSIVLDELLLAAGETIWETGPLNKGSSLCHGTAGNGEAFLALYQRTGDALWLDRARRFAMHALSQCERARQAHGRGRYSLWVGDAGLAVFVWQCLTGRAGMPGLDFLR
jgi:hypothetical protein